MWILNLLNGHLTAIFNPYPYPYAGACQTWGLYGKPSLFPNCSAVDVFKKNEYYSGPHKKIEYYAWGRYLFRPNLISDIIIERKIDGISLYLGGADVALRWLTL